MNTEFEPPQGFGDPFQEVRFENLYPGDKDSKVNNGKTAVKIAVAFFAIALLVWWVAEEAIYVPVLFIPIGAALLGHGIREMWLGRKMPSASLLVLRDVDRGCTQLRILKGKQETVVNGPFSFAESYFPTGTVIMDKAIVVRMVKLKGDGGDSLVIYERVGEDKLSSGARLVGKGGKKGKNSFHSEELGHILFAIEEFESQN